ncbi:Gfo/Idh/MocA family protein [Paenibacillus nasutitermitis]|uniref:Oxidoreductase n=1 Tax=Paenibacillus nasutitermitis TaxID=1652958 RepID=A0A916YMA4_9BACL|nr:Gfo/Idh/MocA family oxidoreductase [Paenibacillus nasutitermitis]GGD52427.1 oxidoreductase [Paenibacillus nasutitermitis]
MKFAIIGCQHSHIKIFIDQMIGLGHQFIGIYDPSPFFLPKQYAEAYQVPLLNNLDEVLERGVEVIGNAAAYDQKIGIIEWAEKHGIHTMTDKPIAIDFDGLNRLQKVIERSKIKIGMMLTERFEETLYTLKQLIDQGELGELLDFTFLKPHKVNVSSRPDWFFKKAINGGLIIDLMVHDIDLLRWLTKKEVAGCQGTLIKNILPEYPDFYDNAQMSVLMEGRVTATIKSDWLMPEAFDAWGDGRIFVTGSKGRVEVRSAGDVLGEPGPFIMLATHHKKAVRLHPVHPPCSLTEDFLKQIANEPHIVTQKDIYESNKTVLCMDMACTKISKT